MNLRARLLPLAVAAALLFAARGANAQATGSTPADDDVQHTFSLTIQPLYLIRPIVELTGEIRVGEKFGAAIIAGAGSVRYGTESLHRPPDRIGVFDFGGELRWYPIGSFIHGLQLGVQALYLYASLHNDGDSAIRLLAQGISGGPFAGYKIATNIGFTFDVQVGVQGFVPTAESKYDTSEARLLVNVNLGWSF